MERPDTNSPSQWVPLSSCSLCQSLCQWETSAWPRLSPIEASVSAACAPVISLLARDHLCLCRSHIYGAPSCSTIITVVVVHSPLPDPRAADDGAIWETLRELVSNYQAQGTNSHATKP